jgi:DNA invertase Pin-like site-specific DNA recombinase
VKDGAELWALYVRESTEGQLEGKAYNSLHSQEDFLRRFVAERGGEVFAVYSDTQSGTKERQGLDRLVHDGLAGCFQFAVAYDLDRWARNAHLWLNVRVKLKCAGVEAISATQPFENSAEGELLELIVAGMAQHYSATISRKVKIKRAAMAAKGMWPGGRPPFGYALVDKKLAVVEADAEAVKLMFSMFAEHPSRAAVQRRIASLGIVNRAGKPWTNTAIEHVLRNPVYLGVVEENGQRFAGVHPAIVDQATFDRVQALAPTKRRLEHTNKVDRAYPLAGVLVCGECGSHMTPCYVYRRRGSTVPYYRCTRTFKLGWDACGIRHVNADKIEAEVTALIDELAARPETVERAVREANDTTEATRGPLGQRDRAIRAQLKGLDAKAGNLLAVLEASGTEGLGLVRDRLAAIEQQRATLSTELAVVTEQLRAARRNVIDLDRVRAALADVRLLYEAATPAERGDLVRLLFKSLRFQGKAVPLEAELLDRDAVVYRSAKGSIESTAQLPVPSSTRTFIVRRDPPPPKPKRAPRARKRGPPGESMSKRAEAFRAALAAEPGMTRADLARRLGVSRAWVTRVLGPAAA